jgi:hypothetical protein
MVLCTALPILLQIIINIRTLLLHSFKAVVSREKQNKNTIATTSTRTHVGSWFQEEQQKHCRQW